MDTNEAHDTLMWMLDLYTRPVIGVAVRLGDSRYLGGARDDG